MTDEMNPNYILQGTATGLLLQAAKGEINLTQAAKQELANRGLGLSGEWIGFPAAHKYWNRQNCNEVMLCPDDLIRPCILISGHEGFHDGGVR